MTPMIWSEKITRSPGSATPGVVMRIAMRSTQRGSPDGINVQSFAEGQTYDVPVDLGDVFVREGWAEAVEAPPAVAPEPKAEPQMATAGPKETAVKIPAEQKAAPVVEVDGVEPDLTILEFPSEDARELIASLFDRDDLQRLRAGETQSTEFPGGRTLVLEAIDARLVELTPTS